MSNITMKNVSVAKDIDLACKVVEGKLVPPKDTYNSFSMIYRTTNENISHEPYVAALQDRKDVLSITGSGDQIINSILFGGKNITSIDICNFSKYYACLKIAAIESLTEDEYLTYIISNNYTFPLSIRLYEKIRNNLDPNSQKFWDTIFNRYSEGTLYFSDLFGKFRVSEERAIIANPYLQESDYIEYNKRRAVAINPFLQKSNYEELKEKLKDANLTFHDGNIFLVDQMNLGEFDLALLSNMINCIKDFKAPLEDRVRLYKMFLETLPLKNTGIAVTYNFTFDGFIKDYFIGKKYEVHSVDENLRDLALDNEILIYKKKKSKYNLYGKKQ